MSKLLALKEWLTLSEAAAHLSTIFEESVSVADIYRFALSKKLVLSVDFVNHCRARFGGMKLLEEAEILVLPAPGRLGRVDRETVQSVPRGQGKEAMLEWVKSHKDLFDKGDLVLSVDGDRVGDDSFICFEHKVSTLSGIWDLPMLGAERVDIQQALQQEIGGPSVELVTIDGPLVVNPITGEYAKILEHFVEGDFGDFKKYPYDDLRSYYPAPGLPADAAIVVRTGALTTFVQDFVEARPRVDEKEKPLGTRERNTFLRLIVALAKEAKIDIREGKGGAAAIEAAVQLAGFDGPKERAIRDILRDAGRITEE